MPFPIIAGIVRGLATVAANAARGAAAAARVAAPIVHPAAMQILPAIQRAAQGGDMFSAVEDAATTAAHAFGPLQGAVFDTAKAMVKMPWAVKGFGDSLIEAQRRLTMYSGTMAEAAMKLGVERFGRDIRMASFTEQSFTGLTKAQNALEERLFKYDALFADLKNSAQKDVTHAADKTVEWFEKHLPPWMQTMLKILELATSQSGGAGGPLADVARDIGAGRYSGRTMPPLSGRPR